ncbi:MAG: HAMP domain-containing protein [Leptolyngbyaceae cyanobacterium RU_5_1]|nr:HAMP domain-containing protein [Leptolyngbyaceae cyanobacterium RU_5_1]
MTSLHPKSIALTQSDPTLIPAPLNPNSAPAGSSLRRKISLRLLVTVSFVVPIIAAVGLTSWFSIRNGQKAVNDLSEKLQREASSRVSTHLDAYLNLPHQINQINLDAVELDLLDLQNFNTMGRYFWRQMQVLNIGYISYANPKGEFIGVERLNNEALVSNEVSPATQNRLFVYQTDKQGKRTKLEAKKDYDPRVEAWYADPVKAGKPLWSKVYQWEDKPEVLSISSSYPVYDDRKTLIGVLSIDLILSQINQFLNQFNVSPSARVFIVEKNGSIVANSGKSQPYRVVDGKPQRLMASDSDDELIRATGQHLKDTLGDVQKIQAPQLVNFSFKGEQRFVQITPWKDKWGLDWRIVVVTSESDFMAQINANTRNTIALSGVALLIATLLGILISRWITQPVIRLSRASEAIANGDLGQTVAVNEIGELGILAQSFNQMAHQLQVSFTALAVANQGLEQRVAERTALLQEESQILQQDVNSLLEVVAAVEEGDLTITAEVSPHVTGLVADTFNRLIGRLGEMMAIVFTTARQVSKGTETLKQLSGKVAADAQQQTQALAQVQRLIENVDAVSQEAALQSVAADTAVQQTKSAIAQGQQEILTMTQGIELLQRDTEHIVKRAQTLANYVDSAAQFAKDQKRIAAMTRILAVNASMLSNRASAQQDPEQMAVITREFETISLQVNQLASQTNQSLILLQQRTDQIQTVVSGLNDDVEEISQQVGHFTTGVEQSQQAFDTIQAVSEQVAQIGQRVTQTSQAIVDAAQTTLQSVRQVSAIAAESSDRANITQTQAEQMEELAQTLLQTVEFFRLPAKLPLTSNAVEENRNLL